MKKRIRKKKIAVWKRTYSKWMKRVGFFNFSWRDVEYDPDMTAIDAAILEMSYMDWDH